MSGLGIRSCARSALISGFRIKRATRGDCQMPSKREGAGPNLPADSESEIIERDCISGMGALPDGSADLVFADPPYNLQLSGGLKRPDESRVDGVHDEWDRFDDLAAYDTFCRRWLSEARRILKDDGSIWVIGSYHNVFRLGSILQDLGFWILNDVVWQKANPMPNFRGRRLTNAHETLIWAAKSPRSRYTFNYRSLKAGNEDTQMRSDWTFPICSGRERLKGDDGRKAHPTQKPEALLHRVLMTSTRPGDLVVDPFMGSGTTGAAAKRLHRKWLGFEMDSGYAAAARRRIEGVVPVGDASLVDAEDWTRRKRVPFVSLVESEAVPTGSVLVGGRRGDGPAAKVCADGTVVSGHRRGSIHQVGAAARGTSSCNGWTYWHMRDGDGVLRPLDAWRETAREALQANAD